MPTSNVDPAGWYPAPSLSDIERWWNGVSWGEQTRGPAHDASEDSVVDYESDDPDDLSDSVESDDPDDLSDLDDSDESELSDESDMSDEEYLAYLTELQEVLDHPPAPTPRQRLRSYLALLLMVILGVVVLAFLSGQRGPSGPPAILGSLPPISTQPHVSVLYDFAGSTSDATLTFTTPTSVEQHDFSLRSADVGALPTMRFSFERGEFVSFRALNLHAEGTISCTIWVNGDIISQNTSLEPYGTATCEGEIPQR